MRIVSLRYLLPLAALFLAACSDDAIRSPDLPGERLVSGPNISCVPPGPLAVGQTAQCSATGCVYQTVDAEGNVTRDTMRACPAPVWSVDNDNGTIDDDGTFTATKPGTTTITGTIPGGSGDTTITVSAACAESVNDFTIAPLNATVIAGRTQTYTASLKLSDDSVVNVTSQTNWAANPNDRVTFAGNVASTPTDIAEDFTVQVTGTYTGSLLCPGVAGPATRTTDLNVQESTLLTTDGICLDVIPPATNFPGCRADTGPCVTPDAAINLEQTTPPQTRDLVVRARYNNGLECNVTAESVITSADTAIATVDGDTVSGIGVGTTSVTATFEGKPSAARPVVVTATQVLGKNSLSVFSKTPYADDEAKGFSQTNTYKFACIGANNLVVGLNGEPARAGLKAFALAAKCASNMVDEDGNCTALPPATDPPADPPPPASADGFNAFPRTHAEFGVTNPLPADPALPLIDGMVWNSVAGYWNGPEQGCVEESTPAFANVGDVHFDPRVLQLDDAGMPIEPEPSPDITQGANQPNGLIYADAAVRVGFTCVTATYTNPTDPEQTLTDGMTVLILPATNDAVVGTSGNDGNQLCDTLAPLFGDGRLLGLAQLTPVLAQVTSGLTPVLEGLDALPIDSTVTALQGGLSLLTAPLLTALADPVLNPLGDGLCQVTSAVNILLGALTGTTPQQECEAAPENPAP